MRLSWPICLWHYVGLNFKALIAAWDLGDDSMRCEVIHIIVYSTESGLHRPQTELAEKAEKTEIGVKQLQLSVS